MSKASHAGTFSGMWPSPDANFSFTVNSADTWEYKTVVVSGDTTGTWGVSGGIGLQVWWSLACGSTFTGTANTWAAADYHGATGTINGVAATSDYFQLTGVVLIPGSIAPSAGQSVNFIRPFDEELALCQRYYEKTYSYATLPGASSNFVGEVSNKIAGLPSGTYTFGYWCPFKVKKRAAPTLTIYSPQTGTSGKFYDAASAADQNISGPYDYSEYGFQVQCVAGAASTTFQSYFHYVADSRM
jgi:hypothetical protein